LSIWTNKDMPSFVQYEKFQETFGNDVSFGIMYKTEDIFTKEQLAINASLSDKLLATENIEKVFSLTNAENATLKNYKIVKVKKVNKNTRNMKALKKRTLADPVLADNFISPDGKATLLWLQTTNGSFDHNNLIIDSINKILSEPEFEGIKFHFVGGIPVINQITKIANKETGMFVAICVVIMLVLLRILLHSYRMAILPIMIGLSSALLITGFYVLHHSINVISGIMPLMLIVISIANSVHVVIHFKAWFAQGKSAKEAIICSLKELAAPCLFTNVTTGIAFFAFASSALPPLKFFGIYTAIGTIITYILTFTLLPAIMVVFSKGLFQHEHVYRKSRMANVIVNLPFWVSKHRLPVILVSGVILVFSILGVNKVEFQTDQLRYLHESNQVRQSMGLFQDWFKGVYPVELIIEAPEEKYFFKRRNLRKIEGLEKQLLQLEVVNKIYSPNTLLGAFKRRLAAQAGIKFNAAQEQKGLDRLIGLGFEFLKQLISSDGKQYRISIKASWLDNAETEVLVESILALGKTFAEENKLTLYTTGYTTIYTDINRLLIKSQKSSITISFILIFIMIIIMTRKLGISILAMIPNVLPVLSTIGIMGWLGVKLDVATVLIAAVSLGIAVDDTIHLIYSFNDHQREGKNVTDAISIAMRHVGEPLLITTAILIGGFSIMIMSSFLPIAYFGIFISLNVVFALTYDLVLLPALISFTHLRKRGSAKQA
ncbi:MAG: MMPL family transporter, partial [Leptospirales bacterium]